MLYKLIVPDLESDLVTGLDSVSRGVASGGALVAAEVVGVYHLAGVRWHVIVAVLTSVGVIATNSIAVDDETGEDVMSIGKRREQREKSDGLHDEGIEVNDSVFLDPVAVDCDALQRYLYRWYLYVSLLFHTLHRHSHHWRI